MMKCVEYRVFRYGTISLFFHWYVRVHIMHLLNFKCNQTENLSTNNNEMCQCHWRCATCTMHWVQWVQPAIVNTYMYMHFDWKSPSIENCNTNYIRQQLQQHQQPQLKQTNIFTKWKWKWNEWQVSIAVKRDTNKKKTTHSLIQAINRVQFGIMFGESVHASLMHVVQALHTQCH